MSVPVLREVVAADRETLFRWRNLPEMIALSGSRRAVAWEEHCAWFPRLLEGRDCLGFVVEVDGVPAGCVRLDRDAARAWITIYLLDGYTGCGHGVPAIRAACAAASRHWPDLETVEARVQPDNARSCAAFARAGFAEQGEAQGLRCFAWWSADADTARIVSYYTERLDRHGLSPLSLDWGSRESQQRRFGVLAGIGALDGASLLDVGCGLGDLYAWLREQGCTVDYAGVDLTPSMVERARARFPEVDFAVCDLLAEPPDRHYDYVFASGIFYLRQQAPMDFVEAMAQRLFALCRRGVAFNLLSTCADRQDDGEFYADPAEVLRRCLAITPRVVLRHDYQPNDFSVYLYRA